MTKITWLVCSCIVALVYMMATMIISDYHVSKVIAKYQLPKDLFGEESGYTLSKEDGHYKHYQITYGEVLAPGIANMFALAKRHGINRFIDLGSGTGKTVIIARLMGFPHAAGIEIVSSRHQIAIESLAKLPPHYQNGIQFIQGDAFDYSFPANTPLCIFMSNLVWTAESIRTVFHRIASSCAPGTLVVSSYSYMHPYTEEQFTYLGTIKTPMTWNYFSYCYVHQVQDRSQTLTEVGKIYPMVHKGH